MVVTKFADDSTFNELGQCGIALTEDSPFGGEKCYVILPDSFENANLDSKDS
jgi:hypothetical protein